MESVGFLWSNQKNDFIPNENIYPLRNHNHFERQSEPVSG